MAETARSNQPIGTIASRYVISVDTSANLRSVLDHLINGGVSLVVVDDSGSVAGVVSEHDVLRAVYDGADIDEIWAADIMSTDITAADPEQTIAEGARLMLDNRLRHLLVPGEEGGVVSIRDVLDAFLD